MDPLSTTQQDSQTSQPAEKKRHVAGHIAAIIAGFVLAIAGLGMSVSIVLLPIGIPVGLIGLVMLIWGTLSWNRT